MSPLSLKSWLLERAAELGFVRAGVAAAGPAPHAGAYRAWLERGQHASMDYMARHVDQRCDLRTNFPWARSVLCLAASYTPADEGEASGAGGPIARYARGRDYHKVLRGLCRRLADELAERCPGVQTRICVDTAPVLERDWAAQAGLGWIGVNGCLIHPELGSYLLLAEIVLSIELPPDEPMADQCGRCRRCMEACPNGAIIAPRVLDARRCTSWATIEHRGEFPSERVSAEGRLFGCDICQEACPYNRLAPPGLAELTSPGPLAAADLPTVLGWSRDDWDLATRGSAARRATWEVFLRNACVAAGQARQATARPALLALRDHADPAVRHAARWALVRLDAGGRSGAGI